MNYNRVYLEAIGYELPPVIVTSLELEERLRPVYQALRLPEGQLEALTGISERRWWEPGYPLYEGAVRAARKALDASNVMPEDVGILIYAAVCREQLEPATACRVAAGLGLEPDTLFDLSNACLGVLNVINVTFAPGSTPIRIRPIPPRNVTISGIRDSPSYKDTIDISSCTPLTSFMRSAAPSITCRS